MHHRQQPVKNRFVYPVFFTLLKLDELRNLDSWIFGINKWRPFSLYFKDYGDGRAPEYWIRDLLEQNRLVPPEGPIWLQTFPRIFGFAFNPVSFWYCTRADGSVAIIIAEVNNTFGEKHLYILEPDSSGHFKQVRANKVFYVSPFYPVEGEYRFSFNTELNNPSVKIDYFRDNKLELKTAISGKGKPLTKTALFRALFKQPLLTLGVVVKIHWQALRLFLKGVSIVERPVTSSEEASR